MLIRKSFLCLCFIVVFYYPAAFADNLPDLGTSAESLMSPLEEQRLGQEFMRTVRNRLKIINDPLSEKYIQFLGESLASQIDTRGQTFQFFLVDDPDINAFAGPGGYIGIHTGLIAATETEGELASVMAHEIAHVLQRHLLRQFDHQKDIGLLPLGAIIAALLLGQGDAEVTNAVMATTIAGTAQNQLSYSRAYEKEADRVGIEMLARAGFNPEDMPRFFEILQDKTRYAKHNVPEFLLTHPVTMSRIADTRNRARQLAGSLPPDFTSRLQFSLIKTRLAVLTDKNPTGSSRQQLATQSHSASSLYGQALKQIRLQRYSQAEKTFAKLIKQDNHRIPYWYGLVETQIAAGKLTKAQKTLESALDLFPGNTPLLLLQAQVLIDDDNPEKALKELRRHLLENQSDASVYRLTAAAAQKAGLLGEAYESLAQFHLIQGNVRIAINHLQQALLQADLDRVRTIRIQTKLQQLKSEVMNAEKNKEAGKSHKFVD